MRVVQVRSPKARGPAHTREPDAACCGGLAVTVTETPGRETKRTLFKGKWLWVEILLNVSSVFERKFFLLKFHLLRRPGISDLKSLQIT